MKKQLLTGILLAWGLCLSLLPAGAEELDKKRILKQVDEYRNFSDQGFIFDFEVKASNEQAASAGAEPEVSLLRIAIRDGNNALCKFIAPPKMTGQYLLMLDDSFWSYVKGMNAPIRIAKRQMLVGQVSTGDITRIIFSEMYEVGDIKIEADTLQLSLAALPGKGATYNKVLLLINKANSKPISAECYAETGIKLKTVRFTEYRPFNGKEILTRFEIFNELNKIKDEITLSNYTVQSLPAQYYNKNFLKFLKW